MQLSHTASAVLTCMAINASVDCAVGDEANKLLVQLSAPHRHPWDLER
jgi:hypothetical protein